MELCKSTGIHIDDYDTGGAVIVVKVKSMLDCQVTVQENAFVRYLNTGEIPTALGTRHPVITPFQAFQTKDSYITVALRGGIKDQWPLFCAAIDRIDIMDDPRFTTGWLRTENYRTLEPILAEAMRTRTTQEWIEELEPAGYTLWSG